MLLDSFLPFSVVVSEKKNPFVNKNKRLFLLRKVYKNFPTVFLQHKDFLFFVHFQKGFFLSRTSFILIGFFKLLFLEQKGRRILVDQTALKSIQKKPLNLSTKKVMEYCTTKNKKFLQFRNRILFFKIKITQSTGK